jgi:hypothetical protein
MSIDELIIELVEQVNSEEWPLVIRLEMKEALNHLIAARNILERDDL